MQPHFQNRPNASLAQVAATLLSHSETKYLVTEQKLQSGRNVWQKIIIIKSAASGPRKREKKIIYGKQSVMGRHHVASAYIVEEGEIW